MKPRTTIFLSGVTSEFGTFRDAVESEIQKKGCFAENQSSFPPDYTPVEEMLTRKLTDSDAAIHIVGFRFGAEPNQRPAGMPRRSYTQMEFDIARRLEKPMYVFISKDSIVRDDAKPDEKLEDEEAQQLQLEHRETVQKTNHLYYFFKDETELCTLVAEIPPVAAAEFRADISRIDRYGPAELIGREDDLKLLSDAWANVRRVESPRPRVITFVALGGEGKTSLVAKWAADLAHEGWPGCDAAFAWSFYSQGTREQTAVSSDLFLKEALTFFSDPAMASGPEGAYEKGRRLARLIGEHRALLILDGLEPLQYAPTSPRRGELKDPGIAALLKGLAAANRGLCVVTTRYSVTDLKNYWQTTAPEYELRRLSSEAGVALLRSFGVRGTQNEFEQLVEDVKGHALTLNLFGGYLRDAHAGDIRKRDLVKLEEADEEQGGHAFRVMDAYVRWFESEGEKGKRALAVLRLLGLFDQPATADCLEALEAPPIHSLTEVLVGMAEAERNIALRRLEEARLLTVNRDAAGRLLSLDAHPLLREYFARYVRTQNPEVWRAAHRRLYEHLCATTHEGDQPTLDDLQPLYQAVAHGCQAGLQQEACDTVYYHRIRRGEKHYAPNRLGAWSFEAAVIACFFNPLWSGASPSLKEEDQAWLLSEKGSSLRALGHLTDALLATRAGLEKFVAQCDWKNAAISAGNLSQLNLKLGDVTKAVRKGEESVIYADRNDEPFWKIDSRAAYADALHQAGYRSEAAAMFREAEAMQAKFERDHDRLYSLGGVKYCDMLLAVSERATWRLTLSFTTPRLSFLESCRDVSFRAAQILEWAERAPAASRLSIALKQLTLGRTAFYEANLSGSSRDSSRSLLRRAVDGLRHSGNMDHLPYGLLARAWLRFLEGDADGAQADLDEAWEIAERGPMRLHMADIHLYRARLFHSVKPYPWESPHVDLAAARALIERCGYWRRKEELQDAEAAAQNWQ